MATRPQATARTTAMALIREGRAAGWRRVVIDIKPDGAVQVDASMSEEAGDGDFSSPSMKMGSR